jgi:hypothetical protein
MPIKKLTVEQAATKYHQARRSALEELEEWHELKSQLNGIRKGEALVVELPNSKIKNLRATFKRRTRNYIRKKQLPLTVRSMTDSSGVNVVIVESEPTRKKG